MMNVEVLEGEEVGDPGYYLNQTNLPQLFNEDNEKCDGDSINLLELDLFSPMDMLDNLRLNMKLEDSA